MRIAWEPSITHEGGQVQVNISALPPPGSPPEYRAPVTGNIAISNAGGALTACGRLQTTAVVPCSRCASPHMVVVDVSVSEECTLQDLDQPQVCSADESASVPFPILNGNEIDLSELVRQLLYLSLPPRSLCRPDCAGLCSNCGQDLNQGP